MSIRAQLIIALAGAALLAGGAWWLRHDGYRQGEADTKAKALLQTITIEQGMQYERDKADAKHRGAVLARDVALRDLAGVRGELDRLLRTHGRDSANPGAGRRPDDIGPDWIGGFAACYGEYEQLATDAAGWADQVNGLQGYVRSLQPRPTASPAVFPKP